MSSSSSSPLGAGSRVPARPGAGNRPPLQPPPSSAASLAAAPSAQKTATTATPTTASIRPAPRPINNDNVLLEISACYPHICEPDYQEVPFALQLIEGQAGNNRNQFEKYFERLKPPLQAVVEDCHTELNFAVQFYTETCETMHESLLKIQKMRNLLTDSRDTLHLRHFDLAGLWEKSQSYSEMLRIISLIDELRKAPVRIENLASSKYYYSAVLRLLDATKIASGYDCSCIGALDEIRKNLASLREKIFDSLVNDINNHVYLKSPFAEDRWATFVVATQSGGNTFQQQHALILHRSNANTSFQNQGQSSSYPQRHLSKSKGVLSGSNGGFEGSRGGMTSMDLTIEKGDLVSNRQQGLGTEFGADGFFFDDEQAFARENIEISPEVDSLAFITLCLESLYLLGSLYEGLVQLRQRIPGELFALVEHNVSEFRTRFDSFTSPSPEVRANLMRDFCFALYAKFESVMECHRLICNVADMMSRREGFKRYGNEATNFPVYSSSDVWQLIQAEMRVVISNHLVVTGEAKTTEASGFYKNVKDDPNVFKINRSTLSGTMRSQYSKILNIEIYEKASMSVTDPYASEKILPHEKLFIADNEYISTIYRPTLEFMKRMKLYSNSQLLDVHIEDAHQKEEQFLEEFIVKTYIPMTWKRVQEHVNKYINGPDGFVVDENNLFQSATYLLALIKSLCATIDEVPFQKIEYVRMIENIMSHYLDRCEAQFNACTTFVQQGKDVPCCSRNWFSEKQVMQYVYSSRFFRAQSNDDRYDDSFGKIGNENDEQDFEDSSATLYYEIDNFASLLKDRSLLRTELIFDARKLEILAFMRVTLQWFTDEVSRAIFQKDDFFSFESRRLVDENGVRIDPNSEFNELGGDGEGVSGFDDRGDSYAVRGNGGNSQLAPESPTWADGMDDGFSPSGSARVQDAELKELLEKISKSLKDFQEKADSCLVVLRFELRCHAIYFLDLAVREGSYYLDDETNEPEAYVLQLNSDIIIFEEIFSRCLPEADSFFVFEGISILMCHLLIHNSVFIEAMNRAGAVKMIRSVQALHQNLLNIALCSEMRLDHARKFYELYLGGAKAMLSTIDSKNIQFSKDEYFAMLDLMFNPNRLDLEIKSENIDISSTATTNQEKYKNACEKLNNILPETPDSNED